ncbi:NADH-quinone oxidoreductase subunit M [Parvularcula sp. LCG005]|uniref:NADH-quinone oxidoreductase subunit M n=1 Tax=Parvularcula sp. LCG005 TaxID=3078805 RepID=UPI002942B408|nr:NADH-quinone oxidoreductase subunit M [Parvularcula sp. LCG005]WOI54538.1 NADH-quinone oxidoreductase subunit M [Parvularcula sp. LCG005]
MIEQSVADLPLLSILTYLPLSGVVFILLRQWSARADEQDGVARAARWVALLATAFTFGVSVFLYFQYDQTATGFQFVEEMTWFGGCGGDFGGVLNECAREGIKYKMGVDGVSILFIVLTTFIMPICILASWDSIKTRVAEYLIAFLVLETLILGVFSALDLMLFYVFFEGSLIPMFLIIGVWGSKGTRTLFGREMPSRVYAALKFFLYTLLGSLFMLVALIYMYLTAGTTDVVQLMQYDFDPDVQRWLWVAFFASFAVKMPMWPVHTWLPDAHVQAPTAGSILLAAILLKMGGYGLVRFSLPMFPDASVYFAPLVFTLSVIAIIYTSLVAFAQEDMKKLIAYSSVAHMGFVTMGIFTGTQQGIDGAMFQMLSHGFISGALFFCVGVVYDRVHTREIAAYGGLVQQMKWFAFFFLLFTMGNVGLPGLSGFVGEILTMVGAFQVNTWVAALASLGVILSAGYGLRLYREVMFGPLIHENLKSLPDLNRRELGMLTVLAFMALYLGVHATPTLKVFEQGTTYVRDRLDSQIRVIEPAEDDHGSTDHASVSENVQ